MAYDVRRFPKGVRSFAQTQMTDSKHRNKPPSRFARRKPSNILQVKNYFHFIVCFKSGGKFWHANCTLLKFFSFNFLSVSFQTFFFFKLYKKCLFRITSAARWRRFGWSRTFGMPRDSTWFQGSFFIIWLLVKAVRLWKIYGRVKGV